MTTPPQPDPGQPYRLGDVMPAPARRRNTGLIVGVLVAAAAVLLLGAGALVLAATTDDRPQAATAKTTPDPGTNCQHYGVDASTGRVACTDGEAVVNQGPTYDVPVEKDFKLTIKTIKKQCFGSAGCNISFRIQVAYEGSGTFDPTKSYEVSYTVKGGEDPLENTLIVTGDQASVEEEEFVGTKNSAARLTAVVTAVAEL